MIHVVILAYDEAESLPGLLEALSGLLSQEPEPHRLIVVDDGSKDGTRAICAEAARRLPVTCLTHEKNLGVARAFRTGLVAALDDAAPEDFVITMEGDGSNLPETLPAMLERLRAGFDVVCATRHRLGGGYAGFPAARRLLSAGANLACRGLLRVPDVSDYTLFYRGYRAAALKRALAGGRFQSRGFAANAEILLKVARSGPVRVAEVPTLYRYDLKKSPSRLRPLKVLPEYLRLFVGAWPGSKDPGFGRHSSQAVGHIPCYNRAP